MLIDDAIAELISDDIYLLWEVKAEAEANGIDSLSGLITHVLEMVSRGSARCWAAPISGKVTAELLREDGAILALRDHNNWSPPELDSDIAIWLGSALLAHD